MKSISFRDREFRTSSFSGGDAGTCVEVAHREDVVAVRDSKDLDGPVLLFSAAEWAAFTKGVKAGEFDQP